MQHEWILDVLADLSAYARANGLTNLGEALDDAQMVALVDARKVAAKPAGVTGNNVRGDHARGVRECL